MSSGFVLTLEAKANLAAIAEYVERESTQAAAERVVLELQRAFRLLAEQPGVGHARDDLTPDARVRFWVVFSYLVAFVPDEKPLPIVAVVHGSREPSPIAEQLRSALRPPNG
jgi:toxin ParE1/3/4